MFINFINVFFIKFTRTFVLTPERLQYYIGGYGQKITILHREGGRGGSETPKSDYVIYGWPLMSSPDGEEGKGGDFSSALSSPKMGSKAVNFLVWEKIQ